MEEEEVQELDQFKRIELVGSIIDSERDENKDLEWYGNRFDHLYDMSLFRLQLIVNLKSRLKQKR